jgi:hypothetical protein
VASVFRFVGIGYGGVFGKDPFLSTVAGRECDQASILGAFVHEVREKIGGMVSLGKADMADFIRTAQVLLAEKEDSPVAKELKLVLEVIGLTGLSCDGQEGRLVGVLGQIIVQKYRKAREELSGFNEEHNQ